jgi:hypothetical protein
MLRTGKSGVHMPTKISFRADARYIGSGTVFDADPTFELLQGAFPEARSITWRLYPVDDCDPRWLASAPRYLRQRLNAGRFTVELGDKNATSWAD